jgi:uncharacterized membrane protein YedE/YeeE
MVTTQLAYSLVGGVLIGIAAALFLWLNGRIAGISSVIGNLLFTNDRTASALFCLGIIVGAGIFYLLGGTAPLSRASFPIWLLSLAGMLVGVGTGVARGCTSGHGVCGLGLLSLRSLVATLVFLTVGIFTTYAVRHLFDVL